MDWGVNASRREFLATGAVSFLAGCANSGQSTEDTEGRSPPDTDGEPSEGTEQGSSPETENSPTRTSRALVPGHMKGRQGEGVCTLVNDWVDRPFDGDISVDDTDMNTVVARHRKQLFYHVPGESDIESGLDSMDETGAFSDINYADKSRTAWDPEYALQRISGFTRAYLADEHPLNGDSRLREAATTALQYWIDQDPTSDNWWFNEIGGPREMRDILTIMVGEDRNWLADRPGLAGDAFEYLAQAETRGTGANLLDLALIELVHACLANKPALVREVSEQAIGEIVLRTGEGIQSDLSFQQHGNRLKQYAYGDVYLRTVIAYASYCQGTGFAIPDHRLNIVVDMLLDGHRWMQRRGYYTISAGGRGSTRQDDLQALHVAGFAEDLLEFTDYRSEELQRLADLVTTGEGVDQPGGRKGNRSVSVTGHRSYWDSDIDVQHRQGYFVSLKYQSNNTRPPEVVNGEGYLMDQHKNGVHWITRAGDEYSGLQPVLDWSRLPGLTASRVTPVVGKEVSPDFTGGLSDGRYGTSAFKFPEYRSSEEDGVTFHKAWFFGEGIISCLGSGITAGDGDQPLTTALAQRRLRGDVRYGKKDKIRTLPVGTTRTARADWVHHDGIGYHVPGDTAITVAAREQSGSWNDLNATEPEDTVSANVFSGWLDHGKAPDDDSYVYHVDISDTHTDVVAGIDATVLANAPSIQAVQHPNIGFTGAVFWEPGGVESDTLSIAVDSPCLAQVSEPADARILTVADPAGEHDRVTVDIDGVEYTVELAPCDAGRRAGTSVELRN
jgi:chondroitin AC lyase